MSESETQAQPKQMQQQPGTVTGAVAEQTSFTRSERADTEQLFIAMRQWQQTPGMPVG